MLRTGVPPGDIFRIACTWLPWVAGQDGKDGESDHDLTGIAKEYGIVIEQPICNYEDGYDPPLPPWMTSTASPSQPLVTTAE